MGSLKKVLLYKGSCSKCPTPKTALRPASIQVQLQPSMSTQTKARKQNNDDITQIKLSFQGTVVNRACR